MWSEEKSVPEGERKVRAYLGPSGIRHEVDNSLRGPETDYIHLCQFHRPAPATPVEESWEVMMRLKEEGKVRFIGVRNFDVPLLQRCITIAPVQSLQPPYNLLKRGWNPRYFPVAVKTALAS